jgi:hypothetical protein
MAEEGAVLEAVGLLGVVLLPQQFEGNALARQFVCSCCLFRMGLCTDDGSLGGNKTRSSDAQVVSAGGG